MACACVEGARSIALSRGWVLQGAKPDGLKGGEGAKGPEKVHVLPLYAMLPRAAQAAVFAVVPEDSRLIVVATNVAETSLTIPGADTSWDFLRPAMSYNTW